MIEALANALIPIAIAGAAILFIVLISIGGAMVITWLLGGLWKLLFGTE
jgi:hypothetical protein